jgi:hypothetical protein
LEENKTAKFFVIRDHGHHSLPHCTEIRNAIKIWRIKKLTFPFLCSKERKNEKEKNKNNSQGRNFSTLLFCPPPLQSQSYLGSALLTPKRHLASTLCADE